MIKRFIKKHRIIAAAIVIAAVLAVVFAVGGRKDSPEERARQAEVIRDAVLDRALECYVIEGVFPESLEVLQERYGLTVNTEDFLVVYTPYAENLPPEVRVTYRGD